MIPSATEALRYEYDLTPDSVVIDAGGYEGDFAKTIADRYDCHVHVFEPVMRFANAIKNRLANYPKVKVWPCALGGRDRMETFHVQNDSSGMFAGSADTETVHMLAIFDVLTWSEFTRDNGMKDVALFKINTEGCEYETLEALLEWPDRLSRVRNLQVQFHSHVPNAQARYEAIAAGLSKTHRLTYQTPFVWESWTLK